MAAYSRLLDAIESKDVATIRTILEEGYNLRMIPIDAEVKHPLQLAIELGSCEIVSVLLQYKLGINSPITSTYQRALHCAVLTGNTSIIEETLKLGGDWNAVDENNATALNLLFEQSQILIETKLSKSSNEQKKVINILKVFLKVGMNVNTKLPTDETLLHLSIKHEMHEVAEFLITQDANLNITDNEANTLAHLMVKTEIDRQLERKSKKSVSNQRERRSSILNPLGYLLRLFIPTLESEVESDDKAEKIERRRKRWRDVDFLDKLLSKGLNANRENKAHQLPLDLAMQHQLLPMIPVLIRYTKNLRITDNGTILHKILEMLQSFQKIKQQVIIHDYNGNDDIPGMFEPSKEFQIATIVKLLLSRGLSPDSVDDNCNTPLILASKFYKFDIVMDLLERTANVNFCDNTGNTAFHYIVSKYYQRSMVAIRAFIAKGADLKILNNEGYTPVQVAARNKHKIALHYFSDIHADFKQLTNDGDTLLHLVAKELAHADISNNIIKVIVNEDCKVNAVNNDGLTPLLVALQHMNFGVLQPLIKQGADVNFKHWSTGWTPLHVAVQSNYAGDIRSMFAASRNPDVDTASSSSTKVSVSSEVDIVRTLLRSGAKVDAEDHDGRSPMYYCVKYNNANVMALLLEYGADLNDLRDFPDKVEELVKHKSVLEYLAKLHIAKLPTFMFHRFAINLDEIIKQQDSVCISKWTDEITRMKPVDNLVRTSFYCFIQSMSVKQRIALTESSTFRNYLSSSQLEEDFPFYRDIILGKYYEAVEAKVFRNKAANALRILTGYTLFGDVLEQIISTLNNTNLRRMIAAAESKKITITVPPLLADEPKRRRLE